MTTTVKKLGQAVLTGSGTQDTLYTVPAATTALIKHIRLVNYSVSDVTVMLWHDGVADSNRILPAATILAGGWAEFDGAITMETGDTLRAEAGAATSITATVYGVEFT